MAQVTLINERSAEPGHEFVFMGEAKPCADCPYRRQCLNLESGCAYRVSDIRESAQTLPCAVHEDDVIAVEVERIAVPMNVPTRHALSGNKTTLAGACPHIECPSHALCVPDGLDMSREYRIGEVMGDPPHDTCALDRDLTMVEATPE